MVRNADHVTVAVEDAAGLGRDDRPVRTMTRDRVVRTACAANCGGRSLLDCTVRDGRLVKVEPAPFPDPAYTGLCVRCLTLPQWVSSAERIRTPMRRTGERGTSSFAPISWDDALNEISDTFGRLKRDHGGESIGFTRTSGASSVGGYYRLAALLQASNLYGGVDMAVHMGLNAVFGFKGTFGQDANEWTDRVNSKLVVVWGNNPAETSMTSFRFLLNAQEAGTKLVVIDPRYSATAVHADWWVAPRPGTDTALALALAHVLIDEQLVDEAFVAQRSVAPLLVRVDNGRWLRDGDLGHSVGDGCLVWDEEKQRPGPANDVASPVLEGRWRVAGLDVTTAYTLLHELVAAMPPDRAARITGISAEDIRDLAELYGRSRPATLAFGYGVDRYYYADMLTRAGAILAVLTGNVGAPGGGVGVASHGRGAHEAQLGPEPPLPEWARTVSVPNASVGQVPLPVRALFNQGDWINQRIADQNHLIQWLQELELVVTADHFWQTSCLWSDIVLPASTFLEGTESYRDVVSTRNSVIVRSTVIAPLWDSKPDADIERELATRLGLGEHFGPTEQTLRAAIDESPDERLRDITFDDVIAHGGAMRLSVPSEPLVAYDDLCFSTPTGRAEFYQEELVQFGQALPVFVDDFEASEEHPTADEFPLVLTNNHVRQRAHSTFFNTTWTLELWPEPIVEINPSDADARNISSGDEVEVFNLRGSLRVIAVVNPDYPQGMCNVSEGWKQQQFRGGNLQQLTNGRVNPAQERLWGHANIPHYDTRVDVRGVVGG